MENNSYIVVFAFSCK